jgi:hypothetical protein
VSDADQPAESRPVDGHAGRDDIGLRAATPLGLEQAWPHRRPDSEDRDLSSEVDAVRRLSIRNQIDLLLRRALLLRNACGLLYLAVAVFALASLCVGLSSASRAFEVLMLVLFVIGLATVVWAGILAYLEIRLSHHAITEEIEELRLHD